MVLGEVNFFFQAWRLDLPTSLWSGILILTSPWESTWTLYYHCLTLRFLYCIFVQHWLSSTSLQVPCWTSHFVISQQAGILLHLLYSTLTLLFAIIQVFHMTLQSCSQVNFKLTLGFNKLQLPHFCCIFWCIYSLYFFNFSPIFLTFFQSLKCHFIVPLQHFSQLPLDSLNSPCLYNFSFELVLSKYHIKPLSFYNFKNFTLFLTHFPFFFLNVQSEYFLYRIHFKI